MENTELAKLVVKRIETNPSLFNMRSYGYQTDCGTAACLAGHTMLAAGYALVSGTYVRLDGSTVIAEAHEAVLLLGLREDELKDGQGGHLFGGYQRNSDALARFKGLIDASERE